FLGLGKMGKRMVWKLLEGGHDVVVWNRSTAPIEELVEQYEALSSLQKKKVGQLSVAPEIGEFKTLLRKTRVFWSMVLPGEATDELMDSVADIVEEGDIVIDGGNAFYKDTERRYEKFKRIGVRFLGIGVSGGIIAPVEGFPLMVGGDKSAYEYIHPILKTFAYPNGGFNYFGTGGAGHYLKMVHNGIEYGMMQAIGEGFGVLDSGPYKLDFEKVADLWGKGTIISGFLIDRARDAFQKDGKLEKIVGEIDATGEGEWTINEAKKLHVPVPVTEDAYTFRLESKKDKNIAKSFAARLVAALRHEFGGHKVKEK
ncbi:MAG TPA: NADP-dependent phosphogluconate dehydrogenase, partial [Candidatus Saccharimonadales bacterium]|nr:NADP-dependent phosphogluconate dehydrogenase [Candidatus Saccharimonadales bacterium]